MTQSHTQSFRWHENSVRFKHFGQCTQLWVRSAVFAQNYLIQVSDVWMEWICSHLMLSTLVHITSTSAWSGDVSAQHLYKMVYYNTMIYIAGLLTSAMCTSGSQLTKSTQFFTLTGEHYNTVFLLAFWKVMTCVTTVQRSSTVLWFQVWKNPSLCLYIYARPFGADANTGGRTSPFVAWRAISRSLHMHVESGLPSLGARFSATQGQSHIIFVICLSYCFVLPEYLIKIARESIRQIWNLCQYEDRLCAYLDDITLFLAQ